MAHKRTVAHRRFRPYSLKSSNNDNNNDSVIKIMIVMTKTKIIIITIVVTMKGQILIQYSYYIRRRQSIISPRLTSHDISD